MAAGGQRDLDAVVGGSAAVVLVVLLPVCWVVVAHGGGHGAGDVVVRDRRRLHVRLGSTTGGSGFSDGGCVGVAQLTDNCRGASAAAGDVPTVSAASMSTASMQTRRHACAVARAPCRASCPIGRSGYCLRQSVATGAMVS